MSSATVATMAVDIARYPRKPTGRPPKEGWYESFLAKLRETGAWYLSAEHADVEYDTVVNHMEHNPSFARAAEIAEQRYLDDLAVALPHDSRAYIGKLARLKTRRPEYNDKLLNVNLNVDGNISDDKVCNLVRDLLSSMQGGSGIAALEAHEQKAALPAVSEVRSEGNGASATPRREVIDVQAEPAAPAVTDPAAPSSPPTRSARPPRRKKHVS